MEASRRRLFAGQRVRDLRRRHAIPQAAMAAKLGLSVSYLSQIENNERPLTPSVLLALTREYGWDDAGEAHSVAELARAVAAATDTSIPGAIPEEAVRKGAEKHPQLVQRLVAIHDAYARSQEQLRVLDDKVDSGGAALPWEEVRDWYQAEGNYIDVLDRAAEALAGETDTSIEQQLARHGIRVQSADIAFSHFDVDTGILALSAALPPESRAFELARRLARIAFAEQIAEVVQASGLRTPTSAELLTIGLVNYSAAALLMPYTAYRSAARNLRHDIDRLRHSFGVSFEQASQRLCTLQRPGAAGLPFFFCRVDMAGNITKRHSATRLQFARFGGACPLWSVHEAVAIPDRILVQLAEMPDGTRYVLMAKGLVKPSGSYARSPRRYAVALGCEEIHAPDFVYADDLRPGGVATPIGTSCRICPRADCDQRAFPPAASIIEIDPDARTAVPYGFR